MNAYLRAIALGKSQLHQLDVRHWTSFLWSSDNNRSIFPRCLIEPSLTVHCQVTLINHHTRVKPITFTSHPHLQAITGHSSRVALTCNYSFEDSTNPCHNVVFCLFCLSFFPKSAERHAHTITLFALIIWFPLSNPDQSLITCWKRIFRFGPDLEWCSIGGSPCLDQTYFFLLSVGNYLWFELTVNIIASDFFNLKDPLHKMLEIT